VRKISEVLRLQAEGLSMRQIGQSVGLARSTVSDYVGRARRAGIRWPLAAELDDAELEAKLFPAPPAVAPGQRPEPDWREVHREMKRGRHVTLQLLWLEWRASHPEGWAYSQFCLHYRRWLGLQDVVMRLEYRAGDRLFVDYSGDRMPVGTPGSDEVWQAEIFVAVLGASGYLYVEATRGQDLQSWLGAHVNAFEFYGGVPAVVVPDNLKSGVTKACWYDPEINPSYLELARQCNTVILPTRIARPQDKAYASDCTSFIGSNTNPLRLMRRPVAERSVWLLACGCCRRRSSSAGCTISVSDHVKPATTDRAKTGSPAPFVADRN
jgi:transposase